MFKKSEVYIGKRFDYDGRKWIVIQLGIVNFKAKTEDNSPEKRAKTQDFDYKKD